ncbi:hypothetical protein NPIL_676441 [Nephila pilipes]|uniref:Uncharacterized protein n=1 Tax=Nephila pilipes TaxID=299642 RepID=A0A8X6NIG3_NEPPI|nr:hypothetical protein NPIL_676441 [Nephila pilipes]
MTHFPQVHPKHPDEEEDGDDEKRESLPLEGGCARAQGDRTDDRIRIDSLFHSSAVAFRHPPPAPTEVRGKSSLHSPPVEGALQGCENGKDDGLRMLANEETRTAGFSFI